MHHAWPNATTPPISMVQSSRGHTRWDGGREKRNKPGSRKTKCSFVGTPITACFFLVVRWLRAPLGRVLIGNIRRDTIAADVFSGLRKKKQDQTDDRKHISFQAPSRRTFVCFPGNQSGWGEGRVRSVVTDHSHRPQRVAYLADPGRGNRAQPVPISVYAVVSCGEHQQMLRVLLPTVQRERTRDR